MPPRTYPPPLTDLQRIDLQLAEQCRLREWACRIGNLEAALDIRAVIDGLLDRRTELT